MTDSLKDVERLVRNAEKAVEKAQRATWLRDRGFEVAAIERIERLDARVEGLAVRIGRLENKR